MTWYSPTHPPTTLDAYILKRGLIYPQFFSAERLAENTNTIKFTLFVELTRSAISPKLSSKLYSQYLGTFPQLFEADKQNPQSFFAFRINA